MFFLFKWIFDFWFFLYLFFFESFWESLIKNKVFKVECRCGIIMIGKILNMFIGYICKRF